MNSIPSSSPQSTEPNSEASTAWLGYFGVQIPVGILLVTLLVTNVMQFGALLEQKKQLDAAKVKIDDSLPRADLVKNKWESLAKDFVELSKTNATAKAIQDELRIQISGNAQPGQPAPGIPLK